MENILEVKKLSKKYDGFEFKNINIEYVKDIMNNIPADWNVSIKEKEMLLDYIMERFNRVDEVLELLDLKGGDSSED